MRRRSNGIRPAMSVLSNITNKMNLSQWSHVRSGQLVVNCYARRFERPSHGKTPQISLECFKKYASLLVNIYATLRPVLIIVC